MKDVGTAILEETFSELRVDQEWSIREPRGFTWWGSGLATKVWAEPEFDSDGFSVTRLHASTDLVRDGRTDGVSSLAVSMLGRYAAMSGVVHDKAENRLKLRTSVFAHAQAATSVGRIFRLAIALQAEEATRLAPAFVALVGGEVDESAHPRTGKRMAHDDILNVRQAVVVPRGKSTSAWRGQEMLQLLGHFRKPPCLLANGDSDGLVAEFPFGEDSSLLRLRADTPHPTLGTGLLALLTLPKGRTKEERADLAVKLNGLEVKQFTHAHFIGSWCEDDDGVTFASFIPNVLYAPGLLVDLGFGLAFRSKWAAENVFGDDWTLGRGRAASERLQAEAWKRGPLGSIIRRFLGWGRVQ